MANTRPGNVQGNVTVTDAERSNALSFISTSSCLNCTLHLLLQWAIIERRACMKSSVRVIYRSEQLVVACWREACCAAHMVLRIWSLFSESVAPDSLAVFIV